MPVINSAWRKVKQTTSARELAAQDESYVTIYSPKQTVVHDVVDAYMTLDVPFEVILLSLHQSEHQLYVSDTLKAATEKLIQLKRSGKIGNSDGCACHLVATVSRNVMSRMLARRKDFRGYLRELGSDEVVRQLHQKSGLILETV